MKAVEIMFKLIKQQRELTADDFAREARKLELSPKLISRCGCLFKSLKASGYLKATGRFKTSERNGSSPLPIYATNWTGKP